MSGIDTTARARDRGFALAASLFALVIIGALVTGAFFAAQQEMRVGLNSRTSLRAFAAAEAGVSSTLANWHAERWNAMAIGDSAAIAGTLGSGPGASSYSGSVQRLNPQLFLIRATGTDPTSTGRRTVAVLTRLHPIQMTFKAALTTRGSTTIGGPARLDGRDTAPSAWGGCPPTGLDTLPGLTLPNPSDVASSACDNNGCITGNPEVQPDSSIGDSTFFRFGDLGWNELVAMANTVYPTGDVGPVDGIGPVGTTAACSTGTLNNWGDPQRRAATAGCWNYFPIIYVNGNLTLTGGAGQGILLVSGDIEASGGAEFYGPVIARGSLRTTGTGGRFIGALLVANVDLEPNSLLGHTLIAYSSCALAAALQGSAPGRPVRERSWAEVF